MITIEIDHYNPISQDFYNQTIFSLDLSAITCTCSHSGQLIWYGSYLRHLKGPDQTITLRIARVFCHFCGRTHAILLSSIVPYSQIPLPVQADVIAAYAQGMGYLKLLNCQASLDESNVSAIIRSYKKHWQQRLLSLPERLLSLTDLVRASFRSFSRQFMQIKTTLNRLFLSPT